MFNLDGAEAAESHMTLLRGLTMTPPHVFQGHCVAKLWARLQRMRLLNKTPDSAVWDLYPAPDRDSGEDPNESRLVSMGPGLVELLRVKPVPPPARVELLRVKLGPDRQAPDPTRFLWEQIPQRELHQSLKEAFLAACVDRTANSVYAGRGPIPQ